MPEYIQPLTDRQTCYKCQKTVTGKQKLSKCSKCHAINYCGKECQKADWPRHAFNCVPVMVTEFEGKGRGVVAARDIKMGECIFMDKPLLKLPSDFLLALSTPDTLTKQIGKLPSEAKLLFYKIEGRPLPKSIRRNMRNIKIKKEYEIFFSNARSDGNWDTLFLNTTLLNHSCAPNVFVDTFDKESGESWCEVRAVKDIPKGEEVTVFYEVPQEHGNYSYLVYGCNAQERRIVIQKEFRFHCKCAVCSGNTSEQEDVIKELLKLQKALGQSCKRGDLAQQAQISEKIVDLNLTLYIGSPKDKIWSMKGLGAAAEMAQNKDLEKKALDGMKKLTKDWQIDRLVQWCKKEGLELDF